MNPLLPTLAALAATPTRQLARLALEGQDRLRYDPRLRAGLCAALLAADRLARARDATAEARAIQRLCRAARLAPDAAALAGIDRLIRTRLAALEPARVRWEELYPHARVPELFKAAILKPCLGPREKGVVFISFEHQLARLVCNARLDRLAEAYEVIFSPTWSPPHELMVYLFPRLFAGRPYSLISNLDDLTLLPRISERYRVLPLLASSWVNPDHYRPRPFAARDIDIAMVANFSEYKRHHVLLRALRELPRGLRVVLVGQEQGARTARSILREARLYGVEDRFTVIENPPNETVSDLLCRSKLVSVMSLREGSCVVVAEAMFADAPVALLRDAAVGSRAFINPSTGWLLDEARVAEQLLHCLEAAREVRPRAWAEQTISCRVSSAKLCKALAAEAKGRGELWTRDLVPLEWRPDPRPHRREDRLALDEAYADFERRVGLRVVDDWRI